jgi:hypothetical protein
VLATFSASAWILVPAGWASGGQAVITWYNASQVLISSAAGAAVPLAAGQWTQVTSLGAVPPAAATYASVTVQLAGTPGSGVVAYVAEAALVPGAGPVRTGLVAPETPIRISAWWQGRRYPLWMGYAERWPQAWPDLPQWGMCQVTATDAIAVMTSASMFSCVQGEVISDNPYMYLPCNEMYTTADVGPTTLYVSADANGLIAVDYARSNQVPGVYADGFLQEVNTGLAINLLGDSGTGMGTAGYTVQDSNDRGPALLYYDPGLPGNAGGSGLTAEFWFAFGSTAQLCTLLTIYGTPSSFTVTSARGGAGNGAILSVVANGTTGQILVNGQYSALLSFAFTPSSEPQHVALVFSPSSQSATVYFNGVRKGTVTVGTVISASAVGLGPGRYSYDCDNAQEYESFNYVAAHLAVYDYQLTLERIAAHYTAGTTGWLGVTAAQRFAQILTWGTLGLRRGGYWWQGASGSPEVTALGPAYDLSGSSAADAVNALTQEEGGRFFVQASGSVVYLERWAGYNLTAAATFGDNATGATAALNGNPGFSGNVASWTAVQCTVAYSTSHPYVTTGSALLTPVSSPAACYIAGTETPVTPSSSYTASAWAYSPGGWSQAVIGFDWHNSGHGLVSSSTQSFSLAPASWTFITATFSPPSGTGVVYGVMRAGMAGSPGGSNTLFLQQAAMILASPEVPALAGTEWDYDNTYIYSNVIATQSSGPNQLLNVDIRNPASELQYFRRSAEQIASEAASPYDINDVVTWSLASYANPVMHLTQLVIDAASNPLIAFPVVLALDIGDVVQVNRRPTGAPPLSELGIIEHIEHDIGPGYWRVTYQVSPYYPGNAVLTADSPGTDVLGSNYLGW